MMNSKTILVVLMLSTLIMFLGCPKYNSHLGKQSQKAAIAVEKMGGGGFSSTLVDEGNGKAHNRIEINFRDSKKINDGVLKNLDALVGIVGIDLSETAVSDKGLEVLVSLPDLEYLQLADTMLSDLGLTLLAECGELKKLDIRRTEITENAAEILKTFPKLEIVYAKGTVLAPSELINTEDELGPFFKKQNKGDNQTGQETGQETGTGPVSTEE